MVSSCLRVSFVLGRFAEDSLLGQSASSPPGKKRKREEEVTEGKIGQ